MRKGSDYSMPIIPRVRTNESDDKYDLEVDPGPFEIYFKEKYASLQILADVIVGVFFVIGSILNFMESMQLLGSVSYLIGSVALALRAVLKILRRTYIYRRGNKPELPNFEQ